MAIIINDGWDVAHHHIHEAFRHLGEAFNYNKHITRKFENYQVNSHWAKYLGYSTEVLQYFIEENKQSIKATVLYQAGIEAWISWAYKMPELSQTSKPRSFVPKWETAFSTLHSSYDFSNYANFYREVRNSIVHPSQQSDIDKVGKVWTEPVYAGMKLGWLAMAELSALLDRPFDDTSWKIMCDINNCPDVIQSDQISNLKDLEKEMLINHRAGFESADA